MEICDNLCVAAHLLCAHSSPFPTNTHMNDQLITYIDHHRWCAVNGTIFGKGTSQCDCGLVKLLQDEYVRLLHSGGGTTHERTIILERIVRLLNSALFSALHDQNNTTIRSSPRAENSTPLSECRAETRAPLSVPPVKLSTQNS